MGWWVSVVGDECNGKKINSEIVCLFIHEEKNTIIAIRNTHKKEKSQNGRWV